MQPLSAFQHTTFLHHQLRREIAFFHPRCIDPAGGFFHYLNDDGSIYNATSRHLVNSARMVFCYALAFRLEGKEEYRNAARHGLRFLTEKHYQPDYDGYAWVLENGVPIDRTQHCYGLAFVLLAHAHALRIGITEAADGIRATFDKMERLFWSEQDGLYADDATPAGVVSPYRGQNANMHSCEALIAAFEATGEQRYLHRAEQLAQHITIRQAAIDFFRNRSEQPKDKTHGAQQPECTLVHEDCEHRATPYFGCAVGFERSLMADGWIWEHYDTNWKIDWEYNKHDSSNMFRPWGYQPGHMTEWAKLLLILERHAAHLQNDSGWLLPRAKALFDVTLPKAWDKTYGGLVYGLAPDGSVCDSDKYFWVQAETLAAAALLGQRTGDANYWKCYDELWKYSLEHLIDPEQGGWYRILRQNNQRYGAGGMDKAPHGKTDFYHPMGAILEALYATGATGAELT